MNPAPSLTIRPATPQDVPEILAFICELAEYEKLLHGTLHLEFVARDPVFEEHVRKHEWNSSDKTEGSRK